ncbi:hypothetical protein Taro_038536 [Colocasia esculenta]|uniref:Ureidoglycolate hydrolase n=1 Tax=Colocasia esculenta TaxID=4460 RepID=A0A843W6Z1_COLES|nr:hypothetical protein [Colocasia esculenta]
MLTLRPCTIGLSGKGISHTRRCRRFPITMASSGVERRATTVVKLTAVEATPANFAEFGQVILASADGQEFGPNDAQLELHRGVPRHLIPFLFCFCACGLLFVSASGREGEPSFHKPLWKKAHLLPRFGSLHIPPPLFFSKCFQKFSKTQYIDCDFGRLIEEKYKLEVHFDSTPYALSLLLTLSNLDRFYIMHLEQRKLKFASITHHASVTQCLGSVGGVEWFLGVAKASILDGEKIGVAKKVVKAASGHYYVPPHPDDVFVFRVTGPKFLKLNVGTWHAGPLFREKAIDFYNLELSDTNVVDHTTHYFSKEDGVVFEIEN